MTSPTPALSPELLAHAERLQAHLRQLATDAGGWLPFDRYMQEALYAPGLGYYAAGSRKLAGPGEAAAGSDFITAPELTPWFGHTLAGPVADVLRASDSLEVLEIGAGTGALAASLLPALQAQGLNVRYAILEVSADLRQRQRERLATFGNSVRWLDALPAEGFIGCVVANEVLDAMPVRLFRWAPADDTAATHMLTTSGATASGTATGHAATSPIPAADAPADAPATVLERGVLWRDGAWHWQDRLADATLAQTVQERMPPLPGYVSEINLQGEAWIRSLGQWLQRGAALFVDYGFPRHEFYHPQRMAGTLMCHFRHTANGDPLWLPGLQDITAHVDFTAMADAALDGGLEVLGYTSQSRFLLDAGLLGHLQALHERDPAGYLRESTRIQKLIAESEMGELFKVLAVGRGVDTPRGFAHDRCHML